MLVREISTKDAGLVGAEVAKLLQELSGGETFDRSALSKTAENLLEKEEIAGFLAFEEGDREQSCPIGVILLNQCAAIYAGGIFGEITELYVDPAFRSRGVAARLIEAAAELGRARGWQRLEVGAPEQPLWQRTLAFYQRTGFLETGPRLRKLL